MQLIRNFFLFLFIKSKKNAKTVRVRKVKRIKENDLDSSPMSNSVTQTKIKISMVVTYTLTFLLIASFIVIAVHSFFLGQEAPDIFRDIIVAAIGYFAGAFASFLKLDQR